jgi:hypothetical protein
LRFVVVVEWKAFVVLISVVLSRVQDLSNYLLFVVNVVTITIFCPIFSPGTFTPTFQKIIEYFVFIVERVCSISRISHVAIYRSLAKALQRASSSSYYELFGSK